MTEIAYDIDFAAWAERQVALLRSHSYDQVDWENLLEEIEDLGSSKRDAIYSYLVVLLTHLLKWKYQPSGQKRTADGLPMGSWYGSIQNSRRQLHRSIKKNPSLASYPGQVLDEAYADAVAVARDETGLRDWPPACPFQLEDVLREDWLPE